VRSIALPEEPLSVGVYLSLIPIITGVALSSLDEPSFDAQGNNAVFARPCVYWDRASASKRSAANQLWSLRARRSVRAGFAMALAANVCFASRNLFTKQL
jgi:hypothetical protein